MIEKALTLWYNIVLNFVRFYPLGKFRQKNRFGAPDRVE